MTAFDVPVAVGRASLRLPCWLLALGYDQANAYIWRPSGISHIYRVVHDDADMTVLCVY
ncbi:MAG TPA: hypothetical protein VG821_05895 [Rhizomicrobium sp.]|jgi:hypothetical protein|nr:hypothetical protein [Rhizomicrobium sp.]